MSNFNEQKPSFHGYFVADDGQAESTNSMNQSPITRREDKSDHFDYDTFADSSGGHSIEASHLAPNHCDPARNLVSSSNPIVIKQEFGTDGTFSRPQLRPE